MTISLSLSVRPSVCDTQVLYHNDYRKLVVEILLPPVIAVILVLSQQTTVTKFGRGHPSGPQIQVGMKIARFWPRR